MICFEKVSKTFRNQQSVLQEIDLEIPTGKIVVLIGPSGCGKTTCLKMINRLIRPTAGRILVDGEDIQLRDPIQHRRGIGYVIQQTGLFPHMTVQQNIEIIPRLEKRDAAQIAKRTVELMEMVGLDAESYLYRYPNQLSGGQQQRVGVARAFATDADVILMDEPFSALDPITRGQLQNELVQLQSNLHRTIIFVTHDMDEAIKIADLICIMNEGKILQYDIPERILKHPADGFVSEFVGRKRIWNKPEMIRARDIMIANPVTAPAEMPLIRAFEIMRIQKVDSLMILDGNRRLRGVLAASQLRQSDQLDWQATVETVMRTKPATVRPEDSIVNLLSVVNAQGVSTLPVVGDLGVLEGLITRGSLVTTLSQQFISEEVAE